MAATGKRTVQIERRQRGFMGRFFQFLFWAFNILMFLWLASALAGMGEVANNASSEAEKAGAGLGIMLGLGMIFSTWLTGALVFGLMMYASRGKKIIETIES